MTHSSWNDLNNEDSDFVKFLREYCSEGDDFSIFKLRCIGILYCDGSHHEKASELYDCMQDGDQETIACNDKDFKPNLYQLFFLATEMVFTQVGHEADVEAAKENYDDIAEEFLDSVFDAESKLKRKDWEQNVSKHQAYLFSPEEIRHKLGYNKE